MYNHMETTWKTDRFVYPKESCVTSIDRKALFKFLTKNNLK